MLETLASCLEDVLRPLILVQLDFNVLAELVAIFSSEVLQDQIQSRGSRAAAVEPAVTKLVRDAQERLSYRVARYIEDEIQRYEPTDRDLDYPARLEQVASEGTTTQAGDSFGSWYPTLFMTLQCLSKTYRSVRVRCRWLAVMSSPDSALTIVLAMSQTQIFETLAQEAVSACANSLVHAAGLIRCSKVCLGVGCACLLWWHEYDAIFVSVAG